jgi:hypothetical protein
LPRHFGGEETLKFSNSCRQKFTYFHNIALLCGFSVSYSIYIFWLHTCILAECKNQHKSKTEDDSETRLKKKERNAGGFPPESYSTHYEPSIPLVPKAMITCSYVAYEMLQYDKKDKTLTHNPQMDTEESLVVQAFTKFY